MANPISLEAMGKSVCDRPATNYLPRSNYILPAQSTWAVPRSRPPLAESYLRDCECEWDFYRTATTTLRAEQLSHARLTPAPEQFKHRRDCRTVALRHCGNVAGIAAKPSNIA